MKRTKLALGLFWVFLVGIAAAKATPIAADPLIEARELSPNDFRRTLLDVTFARPGAEKRLRQRLLSPVALDGQFIRQGWSALCEAGYRAGNYRQAMKDCRRAVVADPSGDTAAARTLAVVTGMRDQPPIQAVGSAKVELTKDVRILVGIGNQEVSAVVDTGGQISVMMQSMARKTGVRELGATLQVGTTTAPVLAKLGLIERVRIGDATIMNIPVAILPDALLTFDDGKVRLPFLLGLYPLCAFGRVAWVDHGAALAIGSRVPAGRGTGARLLWHPLGIAVPLSGAGGTRIAQFDTGAEESYLFERGLDLLAPAERAAVEASQRGIGGIGGARKEKVQKIPVATLSLVGSPLVLRKVDVAPQIESGEAARLGFDAVKRFAIVTIDFNQMRIFVEP